MNRFRFPTALALALTALATGAVAGTDEATPVAEPPVAAAQPRAAAEEAAAAEPEAATGPPTREEYETLEARLEEVEGQIAVVQQKFRVLGASEGADSLVSGIFDDPQLLYDAAMAQKGTVEGVERAYRYLALIGLLHADSELSGEAFERAARLYRYTLKGKRVTDPFSGWVTAEPYFMLQWLSTFYEPGHFPQEQVDIMFRKMPYDFFEKLVEFSRRHPEMRQWKLTVEEDNGLIDEVTAVPIDAD